MNVGFGFEGSLQYLFMPHLGVYAGWGWNKFDANNSFAGKNASFEETGYVFGLQFKHPIANGPLSFYLKGAGLYNHIEVENAYGDIVKDSKHGYGWQAAGGIDINLGQNWSFNPGVKFNALYRETDFEGITKILDYHYISARIGLVKRF